MATTGTYGAAELQVDLIDEAFERCGIAPSALSAAHLAAAQRSVRFMLTSWESRDFATAYRRLSGTLTLTPGVAEQVIPGDILFFTSIVRGDAFVVDLMTAREYNEMPDRLGEGEVLQVWHDRSRAPTLVCWNVPATAEVLTYQAIGMFQDPGAVANNLDVQDANTDAFASGLAARLAVKFAQDRVSLLKAEAEEAFQYARQFNRVRGDVRIRPGRRGRR